MSNLTVTDQGLQHVSLFSGVGGIDRAMHRAGVPTVVACEIDNAARGVLSDRFPDTHLYTDVKAVTGESLRRLSDPRRTVLSAGFPCTDLSVAGGRRGMGRGTRSGLFWEVDRILGEFAPAWVVLENVPGLLSAACACPGDDTCVDRGLAVRCDGDTHPVPGGACWGECIARHGGVMGAVLGSLAERGYGFAYRVLDARHFGVPQRRRRVVIVGRLGDDGSAPAQVLLEPEGLLGNPAAGITPRPIFARRARAGIEPGRIARALTTRSSVALDDQQTAQLVVGVLGTQAHTLTAEGHDASEDGTGRGTPIIVAPDLAATLTAGASSPGVSAPGRRQEDDHNIVAFAPQAGGNVSPADTVGPNSPTLSTSQIHAVAYTADRTTALDTQQGGPDDNAAQGGHLVATFQKVIRSGARDAEGNLPAEVWAERDVAATLNLNDLGSESRAVDLAVEVHSAGLIVRRLTPLECERLQGFPDDHTVTSNGKVQSDSPRYKQMGNAVAVPVFEWVSRRILAVDTRIRANALRSAA